MCSRGGNREFAEVDFEVEKKQVTEEEVGKTHP